MGGISHLETQQAGAWQGPPCCYLLYGLLLRSVLPLPSPAFVGSGTAAVEVFDGSASLFSRVRGKAGIRPDERKWFAHASLPDGSHYLRWSGHFEFLISADGYRIAVVRLTAPRASRFSPISSVRSSPLLW